MCHSKFAIYPYGRVIGLLLLRIQILLFILIGNLKPPQELCDYFQFNESFHLL